MSQIDRQATFSGTKDVASPVAFDVARLEAFLASRLPDFKGPLDVCQFKGGQSNPTYLLETPARRYVLRRKPPGKLLPSAHAVDREYRAIAALHAQGFPVAEPVVYCDEDAVVGTAFYVMGYADGRVFWEPHMPQSDPAERASVFDAMNATLARLHTFKPAEIGLGDFGRGENYVARQIDRWSKQYRASETEKIEAMDRLMEWLPKNVPADDETAIVHGDYRLDNMIFHPTEPRVLAVLDWGFSTPGSPLGDFSYHMMTWELGPEAYRGLGGKDLKALGIPSKEDYLAMYCRRTGRSGIPHRDFYMAYNMFRLAAILQGIMGRVVEGTAANLRARESGARARALAEAGWRQVQALGR